MCLFRPLQQQLILLNDTDEVRTHYSLLCNIVTVDAVVTMNIPWIGAPESASRYAGVDVRRMLLQLTIE